MSPSAIEQAVHMPGHNPRQGPPPTLLHHEPPDPTTELFIPGDAGADMGRTDTHKSHLEIILDAPFLTLKGTGPDVEPTSLSGHVALLLTESTSIKDITLQFRGKAKIPMPASESLINNSTSITYVVCNHDWSFLEGDKRHSRTLKAGRHFFPFHLEIGGSLPSSISTNALGGASVAYKLRAVALRPGLSHNLQAIAPVYILRSFTHEALEYQQTLEIENTWPDKLMYSIMLPHKAWAAGDSLVAVLKFSPIAKGVLVSSIVSSLHETTKTYARSGAQEDTRLVCSVRHEIVGGRAVEIDSSERNHDKSRLGHPFSFGSAAASMSPTPAGSRPSSAQGHRPIISGPSTLSTAEFHSEPPQTAIDGEFENHDVVTYVKLHIPPSSYPQQQQSTGSAPSSAPGTPGVSGTSQFTFPESSPTGSSPTSPNSLPPFLNSAASSSSSSPHFPAMPTTLVTPSHTLEPIVVSHRVRWSIFIRNRDGHTSELRCSLPVVILDGRIREEARSMSVPTRRLMLSSVGLGARHGNWSEDAFGHTYHHGHGHGHGHGHTHGADGHSSQDEEDEEDINDAVLEADRELPSYNAHVRDRVANMFLPETVTVRVSNPWLGRVGAPAGSGLAASADASPSGMASPDAYVVSGVYNAPAAREYPGTPAGEVQTQNESAPVAVRTRSRSPEPSISRVNPALVPDNNPYTNGTFTASVANTTTANDITHHTGARSPPAAAAYQTIPHQLPHAPGVGESTPLDWVNSELLLSLNDEPLRRMGVAGPSGAATTTTTLAQPIPHASRNPFAAAAASTPPVQPQFVATQSALAGGSRWGSRVGSRAASPERGAVAYSHSHEGGGGYGGGRDGAGASRGASRPGSRAASPGTGSGSASIAGRSADFGYGNGSWASSVSSNAPPAAFGYGYEAVHSPVSASPQEHHGAVHVHTPQHQSPHAHHGSLSSVAPSTSSAAHGHGVRNLQSLFKATMKPFTALTHHHHHHYQHNGKERAREGESGGSPVGSAVWTLGRQRSIEGESHHSSSGAPSIAEGSGSSASGMSYDAPGNVYSSSEAAAHLARSPSSPGLHDSHPHPMAMDGRLQPHQRSQSRPIISNLQHLHYLGSTASTPVLPGSASTSHNHTLHATPTAPVLPSASHANVQALLSPPAALAGPLLLHRALTEVPDYSIAARGFIGGVPPLTSMRGLPSYEEAQGQRGAGERVVREQREEREEEREEEEEEEERGIEMRRRRR